MIVRCLILGSEHTLCWALGTRPVISQEKRDTVELKNLETQNSVCIPEKIWF